MDDEEYAVPADPEAQRRMSEIHNRVPREILKLQPGFDGSVMLERLQTRPYTLPDDISPNIRDEIGSWMANVALLKAQNPGCVCY